MAKNGRKRDLDGAFPAYNENGTNFTSIHVQLVAGEGRRRAEAAFLYKYWAAVTKIGESWESLLLLCF